MFSFRKALYFEECSNCKKNPVYVLESKLSRSLICFECFKNYDEINYNLFKLGLYPHAIDIDNFEILIRKMNKSITHVDKGFSVNFVFR